MPQGTAATRLRKKRRVIFAGSFAGTIMALFICFVLLVNTSIAFAQSVYNVPALRKLMKSVSWTNSFQVAYDNDYAQYIWQKSVSFNNELELVYVMEDNSNLIMVFRFTKMDESLKGKQLSIYDEYIKDISTGENISMGGSVSEGYYKENELISLSHILDKSGFHSDLDVKIKLYIEEDGTEYNQLRFGQSHPSEGSYCIEHLYDIKKPQDGIIKLERRHPAYTADINVKTPIR